MFVENRRFEPTPALWRLRRAVTRWNFAENFGIRELESVGYRTVLFA